VDPVQTPPAQPLKATEVLSVSAKDAADCKDLAALSYVWILSVVVYITRRDSSFIRFHARQGMVLFALSVGVWFIPYAAKPLELVVLALAVMGFLAAARGEWKDLPVIGPMSRGEWKLVIQSIKSFFVDLKKAALFLRAHLPHKRAKNVSPVAATPSAQPPAGQTPSASLPSQP
jgi:uncharacterized membrane protein